MSETVAAKEVPIGTSVSEPRVRATGSLNWGFIGYCLLAASIAAGWMLRDFELVDPNHGIGYWLGIAGGSLMLVLLFYPAVKKSRLMQRLGWTRHWFRLHIVLGLLGPLLILYHSNFQVAAINSKVALYSMLVVAISGIVGRYIYARIHRELSGKRIDIEGLRSEIAESMQNSRGLAAILPGFVKELHDISAELLGDQYTKTIGVHRSLAWSIKHHYYRLKLGFMIRRELRARANQFEPVRVKQKELQRSAVRYMTKQVRLLRRAAQLSFFERLFSIWHVFHMPLFILMVISALVHVLAVHMF